MLKFTTNADDVKVYNIKGDHIETVKYRGTLLAVTGSAIIPNRGDCWHITSPYFGFVQKSKVKVEEIVTEPPPPEPEPTLPAYLYPGDNAGNLIPGWRYKLEQM